MYPCTIRCGQFIPAGGAAGAACAHGFLVIDDFGLKPRRPPEGEAFQNLIAERCERGATILTSNPDFAECADAFAANRMLGATTLDRLRHGAYRVILDGESCRTPKPLRVPADQRRLMPQSSPAVRADSGALSGGDMATCKTLRHISCEHHSSQWRKFLRFQNPRFDPAPSSVATPRSAKIAAAIECTNFIGILLASLSPTNTAGTSAISIPSVVPMTTINGAA